MDLSENNLNDLFFVNFMERIKYSKLKKIDFKFNLITDEGIKNIKNMDFSLIELDLKYNKITNNCLNIFTKLNI